MKRCERVCYNGIVKFCRAIAIKLSPLLLTLNNVGDIIMAQFIESEHPRDKEGKFTDKELKGMPAKELSDKLKIDLDKNKNQLTNNIRLTSQEWALYYKEVQKVERGEHSSQVNVLNSNTRTVFVETEKRAVLIIDNNKNKVIANKFFNNFDEMFDYYEEFLK